MDQIQMKIQVLYRNLAQGLVLKVFLVFESHLTTL